MKNFVTVLGLALMCSLNSCAQNKSTDMDKHDSKAIVVYFSATGTTKIEAELIAKAESASVVEIEPVHPYTSSDLDWTDKKSRSTIEMNDDKARPEIKPVDIDLAKVDTVFLGYPIWWDLAPRAINTFIESHDLKGKTIIPFATSGGSTIDNSVRQLKREYPDLHFEKGRLLNDASESAVGKWVESL